MARPKHSVIVITGASSGIGRATALAFAKAGAKLVLAARDEESLEKTAKDCRRAGAETIVIPTDVTYRAQIEELVETAVSGFGRIDVWVGSASVFTYGLFEQTPAEVFDRVLETNLMSHVHTARALMPHFRRRGRGVFIVVNSLYARVTSPYLSPYITSKWGLLGFTETLRQEVETSGIDVCSILPATIDTPIYQHAANYTGLKAHPLPPTVRPERVAAAIVKASRRPRPIIHVGQVQKAAIPVRAVAPRLFDASVDIAMNRIALRGPHVQPTPGNVVESQPALNGTSGGWRRPRLPLLAAFVAFAGAAALLTRRLAPDR